MQGIKIGLNDFLCRDWPRQGIKIGLNDFLCRDWPMQGIKRGSTMISMS